MATQSSILFLPGESPWTEELGSCSPSGHKESNTTEQLLSMDSLRLYRNKKKVYRTLVLSRYMCPFFQRLYISLFCFPPVHLPSDFFFFRRFSFSLLEEILGIIQIAIHFIQTLLEIFSQQWEEESAKDGFLGMGNWSPF